MFTRTLTSAHITDADNLLCKKRFAYDTQFPFGALEEIAQSLRLNIHTGCPVTGLLAQERAVELANGTRRAV